MVEKRRWGRVKVPDEKLTCRISEPVNFTDNADYIIDNINPGGICFVSHRNFDVSTQLRFLVKFPFASYVDAAGVWGRVTYCLKIHDQEKYVIGVAFFRKQA